jgi:hypothetical protein
MDLMNILVLDTSSEIMETESIYDTTSEEVISIYNMATRSNDISWIMIWLFSTDNLLYTK